MAEGIAQSDAKIEQASKEVRSRGETFLFSPKFGSLSGQIVFLQSKSTLPFNASQPMHSKQTCNHERLALCNELCGSLG